MITKYQLQFLSAPMADYSESLHEKYSQKIYNSLEDAKRDIVYLQEEFNMSFDWYYSEKSL